MKTTENAVMENVYSSPFMEVLEITAENGVCASEGSGTADPLVESNDWGNIFNVE